MKYFEQALHYAVTTFVLLLTASGTLSAAEIIFQNSFEESIILAVNQEVPPNDQTLSSERAIPVGLFFDRPGTTSNTNFTVSVDGMPLTDCRLESNNISCDPKIFGIGTHFARITVGKHFHEWIFRCVMPPQVTDISPVNSNLPIGSMPEIVATLRDSRTNLNVKSVELIFNDTDVSSQSSISKISNNEIKIRFIPTLTLLKSRNSVRVVGRTIDHMEGSRDWGFGIDEAAVRGIEIELPGSSGVSLSSSIFIKIRVKSSYVNVKKVQVGDFLVRPVSFDGIGTGLYSAEIILKPGLNNVNAIVDYQDGVTRETEKVITYDAPPEVEIVSPKDFNTFGPITTNIQAPAPGGALNLTGLVDRPITISGHVSREVEQVQVNQQNAELALDKRSFIFNNFYLREGTNQISVNALDELGRIGTSNITVYVDQTAPILTIEGPESGSVTSKSNVNVRGVVNDIVEGALGVPQPIVKIKNKTNGEIVDAQVSDKFFVGNGLPLEVGQNVISVTATDSLGNARTKEMSITRVLVASNRIALAAGDEQTGSVATQLPKPIVISAYDVEGKPLVDFAIRFDVLRGAGTISDQQNAPNRPDGINLARNLSILTDVNGNAKVWLTLGNEASPAGNMVRASNVGIAEDVIFTATGIRGLPSLILVDGSASTQYSQINSQPLDPLTTVVYDRDYNRVINAKVRYTIETGNAKFVGGDINATISPDGQSITTITDKNGLASVRPTLGNLPSDVRVAAVVEISANAIIGAAVFNIIALEPKKGSTQFSGVVMNHTGLPLAGVRISIGRTNLIDTTNQRGEFKFLDQVPVGKIDLFIDGRAIQTPTNEQYPALHFETAVIQGQANQLPHPIYLPPVNLNQAVIAGGAEDVKILMPGYEGFEMNIKANSVTFPDGSHIGPIVVSPVHSDRLPMVPPGGSGSFGAVAWTIQPTGTRFDPPIQVKIPNSTGLKRGETQDILQWDHDLSSFVPMGRGTVSEDGSQIITDVGTGISKAGWGGGPPPVPPNCATAVAPTCTECEELDASGQCPRCVPKNEDVRVTPQCRGGSCRLCQNNACRRCNQGSCNEVYNDQIPDGVNEFTYTDPADNIIPMSGRPNTNASFHGYIRDNQLPAASATWTFDLAAYCTPEGNWKFQLIKAEIKTVIVKNTDAHNIEVNNSVIDNNGSSTFCSHFNQIEYGLRAGASTHYPSAPLGGNPVVNCMRERLGWWNMDIFNNWEGTLNHELLHFAHFKEYMDPSFEDFKSEIEGITLPIVEGDTPESAVTTIKTRDDYLFAITRLRTAAINLGSATRPNVHTPFEAFYHSKVDTPEYMSIFEELDRRRSLRQCFYIPSPSECRVLQ